MLKKTIVTTFFLLLPSPLLANEIDDFNQQTELLLKNNVNQKGHVNYQKIKDSPKKLGNLVKVLENFDVNQLSGDNKKAYLINAYNIMVIKSVINNHPLDSVLNLSGFFNRRKHKFSGKNVTLDNLEKQTLFKQFPDSRLHFALVCAAKGCPILAKEAFTKDNVEKLLIDRTKFNFNDNSNFVRVDKKSKTVYLSELFLFYKNDFLKDAKSLIDYINVYRNELIPNDFKIKYIPYDWQLNEQINSKNTANSNKTIKIGEENKRLQVYTNSALLKEGSIQFKNFNNLYTQTSFFNNEGEVSEGDRQTYFAQINEFMYGFMPNLNIGAEFYLKSVRVDSKGSSPLNLFQFSGEGNSRTAITGIAPKIKYVPINFISNLSIQNTLVLPTVNDLEGKMNDKPFLDFDGWQLFNQVFYDYSYNDNLVFTFETGLHFRFDTFPKDANNLYTVPFKVLPSYFVTDKFTVYGLGDFTNRFDKNSYAYFIQAGLGAKYQLLNNLEIEALYTKFLFGKNFGNGETFNIGLRYLN